MQLQLVLMQLQLLQELVGLDSIMFIELVLLLVMLVVEAEEKRAVELLGQHHMVVELVLLILLMVLVEWPIPAVVAVAAAVLVEQAVQES